MYGFYETDSDEVYMRSWKHFSGLPADRLLMGMTPSQGLYMTYFAHEVGHHVRQIRTHGVG
ncbi:MAG: hypothetical protein HGA50_14730 [Deltaproteobacteria bacterium]|nr:hypothetical protein [Deltaproteobacteria bacterium]